MNAGAAIVATLFTGTLLTAVFGPIQCTQNADKIKSLTEKQCGQINGRKEYAECIKEFLK